MNNKYTEIYYGIINQAKQRILESNVYTERHHIIPKSLGGSNKNDNLVILTAREHFICHRLLPKITTGDDRKKMVFAQNMMLMKNETQKRITITSRTYKTIKEDFDKINPFHNESFQEDARKVHIGAKRSNATKKKMSEAWTDERRQNAAALRAKLNTEQIPWNKGKKCPELSGENNGFYGKTHSEEFKEKHRQRTLGKPAPWHGKKKTCPYCNNEFGLGNYKQHHGEACRFK